MSGPPRLDMTMAEAHQFIEKMEGVEVSLQTVYNWATVGRKGVVLRTRTKAGQRFTTQKWVREFLDGIR